MFMKLKYISALMPSGSERLVQIRDALSHYDPSKANVINNGSA